MYSADAIKQVEKSRDSIWEKLSSSNAVSIREREDAPQASSEADLYLPSEKRFSLKTSIAVILVTSLLLWYWLFQLGYYLLGILA